MTSASTAPTQSLAVGDEEIAYRDIGSGSPLLLLQRFRGTLDHWDPGFVDRLAMNRRIIMFDSPGLGGSTGQPRTSISAMADAAADVAAALELLSVDILGWSMGGMVAQALAIRHPQLVRRAVLTGTCPPGNPRLQMPSDTWSAAALKPVYDFEDIVTLFYRSTPTSRAAAAEAEERIASRTDRVPEVTPDAVGAQMTAGAEYWADGEGIFERLSEITAAVLIGAGDDDVCFPMINQVVMLEEIPSATLAVYPDSGHGFHMQYVDAYCAAIDQFLEG